MSASVHQQPYCIAAGFQSFCCSYLHAASLPVTQLPVTVLKDPVDKHVVVGTPAVPGA